jgi:hydroxymethylbilane synthase
MKIRVGTRGSQLALAQTHIVINEIRKFHPNLDFEIVNIKTSGDIFYDKNLALIGGKGLFLKEIEEQLISNDIDIAVHSMKDVPAILPEGLIIDTVLIKEDPRDCFISEQYKSFKELPFKAKVGTSSARRKALLLNKRSDLEIINFRGNVTTRIAKIKRGDADATILAYAGLKRLGIEKIAKNIFSIDEMLPAIAQGAIGIERRINDQRIANLLHPINHQDTYVCIVAERSFLLHMTGDCTTPLAALASTNGNHITLKAQLIHPEGKHIYSSTQIGTQDQAFELGKLAAEEINYQKQSKI